MRVCNLVQLFISQSYFIFNLFILIISIPILHIFHIRGDNKIPFPSIFRKFTRYEEFFMKFMFKILRMDFLYKYKSLRFVPELIVKLARGTIQPSVFTSKQLKSVLNHIYSEHTNYSSDDKPFILRPCPCRDAQSKYSRKLPNVTDVLFTANRNKDIKNTQNNKFITKAQLFKKLDYFEEKGLVHIVLGCMGQEGFGLNICNCHKSVCFVLKAVIGRGIKNGLKKSSKIATIDVNKCKGLDECGKCLTRCQFHAREGKNGKGYIVQENCFGCGPCASSCPEQATTMISREDYEANYFPIEWII